MAIEQRKKRQDPEKSAKRRKKVEATGASSTREMEVSEGPGSIDPKGEIPHDTRDGKDQTRSGKRLVVTVGSIRRSLAQFFFDTSPDELHLVAIDTPESLPNWHEWTKIGIVVAPKMKGDRLDKGSLRRISEELWKKLRPELEPLIQAAGSIHLISNIGERVGAVGAVAVAGLINTLGRTCRTFAVIPNDIDWDADSLREVCWSRDCLSRSGHEIFEISLTAQFETTGGKGRLREGSLKAMTRIANAIKSGEPLCLEDRRGLQGEVTIGEVAVCSDSEEMTAGRPFLLPDTRIETAVENLLRQYRLQQRIGKNLIRIAQEFDRIECLVNGFRPGDLLLFGSFPGMGKSTFLANLALRACRVQRKTVLYHPLGEALDASTERLLWIAAGMDRRLLERETLGDHEIALLELAGKRLSEPGLLIDPNPKLTPGLIRNAILQQMSAEPNKPIGLIILDNLQWLNGPRTSDGQGDTGIDPIGMELKEIAREFEVPVVCTIDSPFRSMEECRRHIGADTGSSDESLAWLTTFPRGRSLVETADLIAFLETPPEPAETGGNTSELLLNVVRNHAAAGGSMTFDLFPAMATPT